MHDGIVEDVVRAHGLSVDVREQQHGGERCPR
jgi:hypothetical protein